MTEFSILLQQYKDENDDKKKMILLNQIEQLLDQDIQLYKQIQQQLIQKSIELHNQRDTNYEKRNTPINY